VPELVWPQLLGAEVHASPESAAQPQAAPALWPLQAEASVQVELVLETEAQD